MSYVEDFNIDIYDPDDIDYTTKVWTTKDGRTINIFAMSDKHIVNTIKFIERKGLTVPYEMEREVHVRKLNKKL